jgi:ubiquinone/menaquinone biosynthesis C-methylase UbiE
MNPASKLGFRFKSLTETELAEPIVISTETTPATQYQSVQKQTMFIDIGSGGANSADIARGDVCVDLVKKPKNKPSNFVCCDAYNLPFKDECFDGAYFCEVIEHLDSPKECLSEIYRVLKPNANLYLSTPNIFFYRIVLREVRGKHSVLGGTGHIGAWTSTELANLLQYIGFSEPKISYATWKYMQSTHTLIDRIAKKILKPNLTEMNIIAKSKKSPCNIPL